MTQSDRGGDPQAPRLATLVRAGRSRTINAAHMIDFEARADGPGSAVTVTVTVIPGRAIELGGDDAREFLAGIDEITPASPPPLAVSFHAVRQASGE